MNTVCQKGWSEWGTTRTPRNITIGTGKVCKSHGGQMRLSDGFRATRGALRRCRGRRVRGTGPRSVRCRRWCRGRSTLVLSRQCRTPHRMLSVTGTWKQHQQEQTGISRSLSTTYGPNHRRLQFFFVLMIFFSFAHSIHHSPGAPEMRIARWRPSSSSSPSCSCSSGG